VRVRWVAEGNWDEWTDDPFREIKAEVQKIRG